MLHGNAGYVPSAATPHATVARRLQLWPAAAHTASDLYWRTRQDIKLNVVLTSVKQSHLDEQSKNKKSLMYQLAARDVQLQPPERKAQKVPESNKHDFFSAVYVYFCRKTVLCLSYRLSACIQRSTAEKRPDSAYVTWSSSTSIFRTLSSHSFLFLRGR